MTSQHFFTMVYITRQCQKEYGKLVTAISMPENAQIKDVLIEKRNKQLSLVRALLKLTDMVIDETAAECDKRGMQHFWETEIPHRVEQVINDINNN